jgi:hypothetical protein
LERQYVRSESGGQLLCQGIIFNRQKSSVESALNLLDPTMVKVVKDARFHAGPVMNGHGERLGNVLDLDCPL